jgi:hypothetical protein
MIALAIVAVVPACIFMLNGRSENQHRGSGPTRLTRPRDIALASLNWASSSSVRLVVQESRNSSDEVIQSWSTQLLPLLDAAALYERIDQTATWDATVNRQWYRREVDAFLNPAIYSTGEFMDAAGYALNHYAANRRLAESRTVTDLDGISRADGGSNTLMYGEAAGHFKPWGQSGNWRDPADGINTSPDGFGGPDGGAVFVFCDNHVRFIASDIDQAVLRALATPDGGERIDPSSF